MTVRVSHRDYRTLAELELLCVVNEVVDGCNGFGVEMAEVFVHNRRDLVVGKARVIPDMVLLEVEVVALAVQQSNSLALNYQSQLFLCVREHLLFCACVK